MPGNNDSSSSPPSASISKEDDLEYYKAQYEALEAELADFQASSRDLEAELEKDVEAAEKRERQLQEKVEALGFEVEEWKVSALFYYTQFLGMAAPGNDGYHYVAHHHIDYTLFSRNANNRKQRRIRLRTLSRKKLPHYGMRTGRCNTNSGILRLQTTTLNGKHGIRHRHWRI